MCVCVHRGDFCVLVFFLLYFFYFYKKIHGTVCDICWSIFNKKKIEEIIISKIKRLQPNTLNAVRRKRSTRSHTDREAGPRVKEVRSLDTFLGAGKRRGKLQGKKIFFSLRENPEELNECPLIPQRKFIGFLISRAHLQDVRERFDCRKRCGSKYS